jgi:hypothetical protein
MKLEWLVMNYDVHKMFYGEIVMQDRRVVAGAIALVESRLRAVFHNLYFS